jgi:orotate phosphoribosyltransferase
VRSYCGRWERGGPLTGGALVAWAVAERLGLGFAATEREPEPSEVGPFPYQYRLTGQPERLAGHRVVVVDDVINAGPATVGTLSALRSANAVPVKIGALLVLGDAAAILASQTGIPLVTTATAQSCRWRPDQYPLCAAGERLV